MKQEQRLVQIEQPWPHQIFFSRKHLARFCKPLQRLYCLALLSESDGFIRQSFRGLVAHSELLEAQKSLVRHLSRFFA